MTLAKIAFAASLLTLGAPVASYAAGGGSCEGDLSFNSCVTGPNLVGTKTTVYHIRTTSQPLSTAPINFGSERNPSDPPNWVPQPITKVYVSNVDLGQYNNHVAQVGANGIDNVN